MVGPLSPGPAVEPPDGDPLVVGVDDERAETVLSALSGETTRRVLATLHEQPETPSALADRLDTSLQNVQYHLGKLEGADLVEAAGTRYSEKGREMTVYAPADRALVFVAGPEAAGADEGLVDTLKRLLGGVGVLALASVAVDRLLGPSVRRGPATGAGNVTADATSAATSTPLVEATSTPVVEATSTPRATGTGAMTETARGATPTGAAAEATRTATEVATTSADAGVVDALATSPGLLFFLGGLTTLLLVAYLSVRR